ncbi:hypothetical protein SAMD00024442_25_42 [Candidatus Symbiothrix dinenymphae]|nr:hypothetical protein SAMD00024442_25_42 [Candidatus Symbiothrix dinenymphae]
MTPNKATVLGNELIVLSSLYQEVKTIIIYAENFTQDTTYVAAMNELRCALDHICKAAFSEQNIKDEFNKAKSHLSRAGYDTFEVCATTLYSGIVEKLSLYDAELLSDVLPEYFENYKPRLLAIKANLADIRANKLSTTDSFKGYFGQIKDLVKIEQAVAIATPALEKKQKRKKAEATKVFLLKDVLICTLLGGVVTGLIVFFLVRWFGLQ